MSPIFDNTLENVTDNVITVRLFGSLELENRCGIVAEPPGAEQILFRLVKYMLIEPTRVAKAEELLSLFGERVPSTDASRSKLRVYIHRLQKWLSPLGIEGAGPLIQFLAGESCLNTAFTFDRDIDRFTDLMSQVDRCKQDDLAGLQLCMEALELYQGSLLENTCDAPWLDKYRAYYQNAFCRLTHETLNRSRATKVGEVIPLLCQRALAIAPASEEVQKAILSYLIENKWETDLVRHTQQLIESGKADWLQNKRKKGQALIFTTAYNMPLPQNGKSVYAKLFGSTEIHNEAGTLVEDPANTLSYLPMLQYLLLNPGCRLPNKIVMELWPTGKHSAKANAAVNTRVRRVREALKPLQLDRASGLVCEQEECVYLTPNYTVQRDLDLFTALLQEIPQYAITDSKGLALCLEALTLYSGPLLEHTELANWLKKQRSLFHKQFLYLASDTLLRMSALNTDEGLSLLSQRVGNCAPEERVLNEKLLRYLSEQRGTFCANGQLLRLRSTGKAGWLKTSKKLPLQKTPRSNNAENSPTKKSVSKETAGIVHVKLFGTFEISNIYDCVTEYRSHYNITWQILKYFLTNAPKEEYWNNIVVQFWPNDAEGLIDTVAARVCLHRARAMLKPLHLESAKTGLIQRSAGKCFVNPDYPLKRDTDVFKDLMVQIRQCSIDDPIGLALCMKALEVYRGPFLEHMPDMPWLSEYRAFYCSEFLRLAGETLQRSKVLNVLNALPLLCQRASAIIPEERDFHADLYRYLVEKEEEKLLVSYATWMNAKKILNKGESHTSSSCT